MRILLDSHAFVWFAAGDERCSLTARRAIESEATTVFVSAASLWEMATKHGLGKWPEAGALLTHQAAVLDGYDFKPLPITLHHGRLAGMLRSQHRDPFERMLAAQAQIDDLVLVTSDRAFHEFSVRTLW